MVDQRRDPEPGETVVEDRTSGGTIMLESDPNFAKYQKVLDGYTKQLMAELERAAKRRHILNDAEMMRASNHEVRFEQQFKDANAFFFSVDCLLDLQKLTGALYRGQCALVFAKTLRQATEYAHEGLASALTELRTYYFTHLADPVNVGIHTFADGRKGRQGPHEALSNDGRMRELLVNRFGKPTH